MDSAKNDDYQKYSVPELSQNAKRFCEHKQLFAEDTTLSHDLYGSSSEHSNEHSVRWVCVDICQNFSTSTQYQTYLFSKTFLVAADSSTTSFGKRNYGRKQLLVSSIVSLLPDICIGLFTVLQSTQSFGIILHRQQARASHDCVTKSNMASYIRPGLTYCSSWDPIINILNLN